jgi:hypothetical protein
MQTFGGLEVCLHAPTSALDYAEWLAPPLEQFIFEESLGAHWTGDWVGHRIRLRMSGAIPPLPHTSVCSSASISSTDNLNFTGCLGELLEFREKQ